MKPLSTLRAFSCAVALLASGCSGGGASQVCEPLEITCASASTLDVCSADGTVNVQVPCPSGQMCEAGACVLTPVTPTCTPDAASCASPIEVSTCNADGMTSTITRCAPFEICSAGECVAATGAGACVAGGVWCDEDGTVLRCNDQGDGFDAETCAEGTTCTAGAGCVGSVCTVGDTRCAGASTLARCLDGTTWVAEQCDLGCTEYDTPTGASAAVCLTGGECLAGMRVCGDPRDGSLDNTAGYLQCEFVEDRLTWVRYECADGLECMATLAPDLDGIESLIGMDVTPGAVVHEGIQPGCYPVDGCVRGTQRCSDAGVVQSCQPDGTWVDAPMCPTDTTCIAASHPFTSSGTELVIANHRTVCHDDPCVELVRQHAADVYATWAQSDGRIRVGICQPGSGAAAIDSCDFSNSLTEGTSCDRGQVCEPYADGGSFGRCVDAPPDTIN